MLLVLLQAYFMLDEMLIAGELQEPSKKVRLPAAAVPMLNDTGHTDGLGSRHVMPQMRTPALGPICMGWCRKCDQCLCSQA